MQSETFIKSVQLIQKLPLCVMRLGRVWDTKEGTYRAVPTCGGQYEVSSGHCIRCGGYTDAMLKNEIKGFSQEGMNLLVCELSNRPKISVIIKEVPRNEL